VRVYLPATFAMLTDLNESGKMPVRSGWGFAATPALVEFYTSGDEEEIGYAAFLDAADASLRLLAIGDEEAFPHRRVVVSVDVDDSAVTLSPENGESVVALSPPVIELADIAAIHIDIEESEETTKAAIEIIDAADLGDEDAELTLGDAQERLMAFYDRTELPFLVELL
jgi:hypothetical protein